jgi:voltage-gated potassium channel
VDGFSTRRFAYAVAAFVAVLAGGTIGFHFIMDEDWTSSVYRAIVTVSLTGLDSRPGTHGAELFTIVLLVAGVTIFLYVSGAIVELIARGLLGDAWMERRRRRMIESLRDHYIVCGYGRVGRRVANELRDRGVAFVVLDYSPEAVGAARRDGVLFIDGDATKRDDLDRAGVERAVGLVAASDSDVNNLYLVLSARSERPDLRIVARASTEDAAEKLRLAGADRVVQPYQAAGRAMANLMLKPQVAQFVEEVTSVTGGGPTDFRLEELVVTASCASSGRTIRELRIRHETGALVIAIRKHDGSFETTPSPDTVLEPGDVLIAVGSPDELAKLEELFAPREEAVAR